MIDAFGMEIAAKPLKLRRQQHGVCPIDLLRRVPPTASCPPDRSMGLLDFLESC